MKTKLLNCRISNSFFEELKDVAQILDIPYSQIVRDALREKIDALKNDQSKLFKKSAEQIKA